MRAVAPVISLLLAGCMGTLTDAGGNSTADAGPGMTPDAQTVDVKAILGQWSGCMTLTNFQTANMADAWSALLTNDGKQCLNCHEQGQYNFIATGDENAFFAGISQHSYFMVKYFSVDVATKKVVVNTQSFKSANNAVGHPKFNADTNAGMTALMTFYTATAANTACDAPKMVD
jgi:hypothetical protein